MSTDDLVARLQAAIEERERKAPTGDGWHTPECGFDLVYHDMACTCPVPAAVLRLCQANRDLIGEYEKAAAEELRRRDADQIIEAQRHAIGRAQGLLSAVKIVARGYGVEDKGDDHE